MKRITSPGSMHDTGCLGLVHWDDPEGWYREGGGWGLDFSMDFSRPEYWSGLKSLEPPVGFQQSTFKSQVTEGVLQGL